MNTRPKTVSEVTPAPERPAPKVIEAKVTAVKDASEAPAPKVSPPIGTEAARTKVKEGMEKVMKTAEELVAFNQGNLEAFVKSGQIWTTGVQDISKQVASVAQATVEEGISTFKALTAVKSLKDVFDLQAAYARSTLEKTLAESGKLTDASFKLTEQALAPLTARVNQVVEKFSKTA